jgi:hypothetical protein
MIRLSEEVLPENRKRVNEYIGRTWRGATALTQPFNKWAGTTNIWAQFTSHVAAEETRLQKNLEDIKYDIDGYDSVRLISGQGRIETVQSLSLHARAQLTPE